MSNASQDSFGNYQPNLNDTVNQGESTTSQVVSGVGAPLGAPLSAFQVMYVDTSTGHIYANVNGAWVLKV